MVRRFILGGLFGCLLGLGLGVGIAYLLRVATTPLLGSLVAAAIGASVAVLVRRPAWRQGSARETLLRSVLGMILGAAVHFALRRFVDVELPMATPPLGLGVRIAEHPVLVGSIVGFSVGILLGIEPAPPKAPPAGSKTDSKATPQTANSGAIDTV